jgi:hypothetical protein
VYHLDSGPSFPYRSFSPATAWHVLPVIQDKARLNPDLQLPSTPMQCAILWARLSTPNDETRRMSPIRPHRQRSSYLCVHVDQPVSLEQSRELGGGEGGMVMPGCVHAA